MLPNIGAMKPKASSVVRNSHNDASTTLSFNLRVRRQSVYNWIKKHSTSGKSGLKIHKRGRPKGTQLQP